MIIANNMDNTENCNDTYIVLLYTKHYSFFFWFIFGCAGSSLLLEGFSLQWLLLLCSMGSRHMGFSSCSTWAQ